MTLGTETTATGSTTRGNTPETTGDLAWRVSVYRGGYWTPRDSSTLLREYGIKAGVPADRDPFTAVVWTLTYMLTDWHKTGARETCRDHRALTVTATDGTALTAVLHDVV